MKIKYKRLTKEEKKQVIAEYKKTDKGKVMYTRLTRLFIIGILGIIYAIWYFIYDYLNYDLTISDLLVIIPLFLISFFFIIMACKLRIKNLNNYVIKKL